MSTGYARLVYPPGELDLEAGRDYGSPHLGQLEFQRLSNKIQLLIAGYGTGKTTVGARKTLAHMMLNPGSTAIVIAPTYRHTETQFAAMLEQLALVHIRDKVNLVAHAKTSRGQTIIVLTNGSRAEFFSAGSPISFFGKSCSIVWCDELEWCDDPGQILQDLVHRLREKTKPGLSWIVRWHIYVTSTAQYLTGALKSKMDEADAERVAFLQAVKEGKPAKVPTIGYRVCPSTAAIGRGLDLEMIRLWHSQMEQSAFERAVLCDLRQPPEVVFGDYVSAHDWPRGHVVDWVFQPELMTYIFVDWGINHPHVILAQYSAVMDALVLFEEWGPDHQSVGTTVRAMVDMARRYGLADEGGRPTGRGLVIIGDPTTNPGQSLTNPSKNHILAQEGEGMLRRLGWQYKAPRSARQRSKHLQMQLVRALLKPANGTPRIVFDRRLTVARDELRRPSYTNRGVWFSYSEGLRFEVDQRTKQPREEIRKDGKWDHSYEASAYGAVIVFQPEFQRLYDLETGLLGGAGAWRQAA